MKHWQLYLWENQFAFFQNIAGRFSPTVVYLGRILPKLGGMSGVILNYQIRREGSLVKWCEYTLMIDLEVRRG